MKRIKSIFQTILLLLTLAWFLFCMIYGGLLIISTILGIPLAIAAIIYFIAYIVLITFIVLLD